MSPDPPSDRQSRRIRGWTTTLVVCASIVLLGIPVRVIQLQIAPSDSLAAALTHTVSHSVPLVRRGDLLDRRGRLVATTTLGWRAFIDPQESDDPTTLEFACKTALGSMPSMSTKPCPENCIVGTFPSQDYLKTGRSESSGPNQFQALPLKRCQFVDTPQEQMVDPSWAWLGSNTMGSPALSTHCSGN